MILRSYVKMPMALIPLPTITDKWSLAEIAYYIACDCAVGGVRKVNHLDYYTNSIYEWIDALIEEEDLHLMNMLAEKIFAAIIKIFENFEFSLAINAPYELIECYARIDKGEHYVTFYFKYDDESAIGENKHANVRCAV